MSGTLFIAEIPDEEGRLRMRYARYMSADGQRWIRHGLFEMYHPNGSLASTGHYEHGLEEGPWRSFHPDGSIASEGAYKAGKELGLWRFRDTDGSTSEERL